MDIALNLDKSMKHFTTAGAFLTSGNDKSANTMVISWGFIGAIWGKPYFITVVRPQRYTKEFMDKSESFTVSIPYGTMSEELKICGSQSGRDTDKSKIVSFIPAKMVESPVIKGCDMYYECKKIYVDSLNEDLLPEFIKTSFYNNDYHTIYFGEIVNCYASE